MEIEAGVQGLGGSCNIGVTTGKAFCGSVGKLIRREYCVVGDVVIMSARLMASKANHGQIFCDRATVSAVGQEVAFETMAPITVKSRVAKVPVFTPRRLVSATSCVDDSDGASLTLVGREKQLTTLLASARQLHGHGSTAAHGRVIVISGPPGIGKTHLVRYVAKTISAAGFVEDTRSLRPRVSVHFAGSGPLVANGAAMAAWLPVLQGCLGIEPESFDSASIAKQINIFLAQHPPPQGLAVVTRQLVDILAGHSLCREDSDPVLAQQVATCAHVIESTAHMLPAGLCVIIEDVQYLENDSWALVSKLAGNLHASGGKSAPLLLLLPLRGNIKQQSEEEQAIVQEVLSQSSPDTGHALVLSPLNRSSVEDLIKCWTGVDLVDDDVTDLVYDELLGVPQFIMEQLALLQLSGAFVVESHMITETGVAKRKLKLVDATASRMALDVPYSLELGVTRSFAALHKRCQLTVQIAAAIGRSFTLLLLTSAHPDGPTSEQVWDDLSAAILVGLLRQTLSAENESEKVVSNGDQQFEFASNTVRWPTQGIDAVICKLVHRCIATIYLTS
eukprot:SAG31_NODE_1742_length_7385_cov_40.678836_5_plen_562_part_00